MASLVFFLYWYLLMAAGVILITGLIYLLFKPHKPHKKKIRVVHTFSAPEPAVPPLRGGS